MQAQCAKMGPCMCPTVDLMDQREINSFARSVSVRIIFGEKTVFKEQQFQMTFESYSKEIYELKSMLWVTFENKLLVSAFSGHAFLSAKGCTRQMNADIAHAELTHYSCTNCIPILWGNTVEEWNPINCTPQLKKDVKVFDCARRK